ncbi:GIY-YIG nuclease family protein [Janthinobacterium sp. SUN033]|uniref:GIY-YIG nuclease family protein n=1 Tax=Janthinobacterium sp. SUN033 TaxID=3002439 RepID=UPI0025B01732|nr:GIY-YIG nuclease family protein [Janthinobacterium sp. SUN033]MDN2677457.1 GIY-YIG nuclease family protein [Janthinobacterium sp. SUN033]
MDKTRQATLKAHYRQLPPPLGIIALRHLPSGRTLLDSSRNAPGMLNRHRFELNLGKHRNALLQADWRRDGAAAFSCAVIDTLKLPDDPAFDADAELGALLDLHRAQWLEQGQPLY